MSAAVRVTLPREVRFAAHGAQRGDQFRVVRAREATGDVPLTVQTTPPRTLAAGEWCDVAFIGRGWRVTAAGSL